MTAPTTTWAVTTIAHPGTRDVSDDCEECLTLAEDAVTTARLTGSRGATQAKAQADGTEHSATVVRAMKVITR